MDLENENILLNSNIKCFNSFMSNKDGVPPPKKIVSSSKSFLSVRLANLASFKALLAHSLI